MLRRVTTRLHQRQLGHVFSELFKTNTAIFICMGWGMREREDGGRGREMEGEGERGREVRSGERNRGRERVKDVETG